MSHALQPARILGPVHYGALDSKLVLPQGPCLMERVDSGRVDIIWGEHGQCCAEVLIGEIKRAAEAGDLVVLDQRL